MLSFFRGHHAKKDASSPLPQPQPEQAHVPLAYRAAATPSRLQVLPSSHPLHQGAILAIGPRYLRLPCSPPLNPASVAIPPAPASSNKFALLFGKGRQQPGAVKEQEASFDNGHQIDMPVYLRVVLVGDHRALAKARSKATSGKGGSYEWETKQAIELVVPQHATRSPSSDLSLVVEAFREARQDGKGFLLARGVVHHFMEHLQEAGTPRVLVLPMVYMPSHHEGSSGNGAGTQECQSIWSEACIRLAYLPPPQPPRHCRFPDVEEEVVGKKDADEEGRELGHEQIGVEKEEDDAKEKKKEETPSDSLTPKATQHSLPPGSRKSAAGAQEEERVSSVGSHLHLDLAANLVEQIRQENEGASVRVSREQTVRMSEQEKEDKVVGAPAGEEEAVAAAGIKAEVQKPCMPGEVEAAEQGPINLHEQLCGEKLAATTVLLNKSVETKTPPPASSTPAPRPALVDGGEQRRRAIRKGTANAARRRAQLARVKRLLAELETLPATLKGLEDPGRRGAFSSRN